MRLPTLRALALALPLALWGCAVSTGPDETPSGTETGAYTPPEDNSADDDLTIVASQPASDSVYLPPAVYMVTRLSEPFLGQDGELNATFGPNCGGGAPLKSPIFNEDRTEVAYTLFAPTGERFCFDLEITLNDSGAFAATQATVNTAPCGVTFDLGYGSQFVELAGETSGVAALNTAIEGFSFPMALTFSDIEKSKFFPFQTTCGVARILQVFTEDIEPTGQWATDPTRGATEVIQGCGVSPMGDLVIQSAALTLPINLSTGGITLTGTPVDFGTTYELSLKGARLQTVASASGAFSALGPLTMTGAVTQADLTALAEVSGNAEVAGVIARLSPDTDTDGNGSLDAFSVKMSSTPRLISLMGCDPGVY